MSEYKRRWGDKRDGRLISGDELDTNHFVMPLVWPSRTENEAFISATVDLTNTNEWLKKMNEGLDKPKYSLFTILCAAFGKTFLNRPKMNRFYRNRRLYERYKVSIGFIVKKVISDDGEEALARVFVEPNDTIETLSEKINKEIEERRSEKMDKSSDDLRILMKFPFFIGKLFLDIMRLIDRKTTLPDSITASDLFFTSIVFSNLGSIRLQAGYHHLSNWGTNSFFTTIGERKVRPFIKNDGTTEYKDSIDLGMTIDERIADGFYYSKSISMLKKFIMHPELLETEFKKEEK